MELEFVLGTIDHWQYFCVRLRDIIRKGSVGRGF